MRPQEAIDEFTDVKMYSSSDATVQNYEYRLKRFAEFCESAGIVEIGNVNGRTAEKFKQQRMANPDVNPYTLEQQMRTFRQFLYWCESNELIKDGVAEKLMIPNSAAPDRVRNEAIDADRAEDIIDRLHKYRYASRHHVVFHILWETGMRMGSLHALDVGDFGEGVLKLRHRPETGTPLKRKEDGQRDITITDDRLTEAIEDFIADQRPNVGDGTGRRPLIATERGRAHRSTIRADVYTVVQPCRYGGNCPHNKEVTSCEYRKHDHRAGCPSSTYPHAIRSGSVTAHLNRDIPKEVVSERANMSESVLDEHYDERTEEEKRKRREKYLS
jgi:site-specific recombinase XerD